MNVSLESIDKVFALLTVKVEKADYQEQVDISLKALRRKTQLPGFRKGMAPMGLMQRMYRKPTVIEEVNKLLLEEINEYIKENNINLLGEPILNEEKQSEIDFDTMEDFEFVFDIAIAPELELKVTESDEVDFYTIEIEDKIIDDQVKTYIQGSGKYEKVDSYQEKDVLTGSIAELDEKGNTKKGGVQVENAMIMPVYMEDDAQKAIFNDAKTDDVLVFNPNKAYGGHEAEIASLLHVDKFAVAKLTSDFSFQVKEITRFTEGELNQELFDLVLGKDAAKSEEEFHAKIKECVTAQFITYSDYKFIKDVREILIKRVGELARPEASLKRFLAQSYKDKDKEVGYVDEHFEQMIKDIKWQLIKEKLVKEYDLKVEQSDMLNMAIDMARTQFVQYGMMTISGEVLENYAREMLKQSEKAVNIVSRVLDLKLAHKLKEIIKLNPKTVSYDEFSQLLD
ncbi:MAG: trigger factor [Mediterranea sp.]|jgi:trigger factor|nr:trigger factor [Mediterranea sp.]